MSLAEVTDEINRRYRPAGETPVTVGTVGKYCAMHGLDSAIAPTSTISTRFDTFAEAWKVRERMVKHTNKLAAIVDRIRGDDEKLSEIASISNAYLNACASLAKLNKDVSGIQKEQLGLSKVRKVLQVLLEVLDMYPEVKARFFDRLRKSEVYDTIRAI